MMRVQSLRGLLGDAEERKRSFYRGVSYLPLSSYMVFIFLFPNFKHSSISIRQRIKERNPTQHNSKKSIYTHIHTRTHTKNHDFLTLTAFSTWGAADTYMFLPLTKPLVELCFVSLSGTVIIYRPLDANRVHKQYIHIEVSPLAI